MVAGAKMWPVMMEMQETVGAQGSGKSDEELVDWFRSGHATDGAASQLFILFCLHIDCRSSFIFPVVFENGVWD